MSSKEPTFTASQKKALNLFLEGHENIFLTGGPGTGKSFLIREYLKLEEARKIPVIASTGAAAILVGGRTFHSFFGLGIMQGGPKATFEKAVKNTRLRKRVKDLKTIVIDEVSMISCDAFDTAELVARAIRRSEEAWGGIRVIVVGDFAQLPPISRGYEKEWCFRGQAWAKSCFQKVSLEEVKRTADAEFLQVLENIRWGKVTEEVVDYLNARVIDEEEVDLNVPHIFPRRAQTEAFNKARLEEISNPVKEYETEYGGDDRYVERLKKDAPIPEVLRLKRDALVMIRMNDPKQRYVNGTVGTVTEIYEDAVVVEINGRDIEIEPFTYTLLDADGEEVAYAINFPITLAYANTIHKMQGTTLDRAHVDLKALWEPGQAYVALSRARSGKSITLTGWDMRSVISDKMVRDFYAEV